MGFSPGLIKDVGEDIRGVCTRPYLIGISGNLVYKALKKRLVSGAVLIGTLFYLGNRAFDLDIKGIYIASGTLVLAVAGFAAQKWAKWALNRSLLFAESHGANLLEHKKAKRFKELYLPIVYENVYALEARLLFSARQLDEAAEHHEKLYRDLIRDRIQRYQAVPEIKRLFQQAGDDFGSLRLNEDSPGEIEPIFLDSKNHVKALMLEGVMLDLGDYVLKSKQIMLSRLGFEAAVKYLLARTDRQRDERMESGLDLVFIEDYLDGAPFHPNNTKVMEQANHGVIKDIEQAIGKRPMTQKLYHAFRRFVQRKWHQHINTSLQASVGKLLYSISRRYRTRSLMVEDVLWRDERSRQFLYQNLLEEFSGTANAEEIVRNIMRDLEHGALHICEKVFHDSPAEVERVVRREYGYSVQDSVYRRVRYDCEYALNELSEQPMDDLKLIKAPQRAMADTRRVMDQARRQLGAFRTLYSQAGFREQWNAYTPETRRALQLAFYINHDGFKHEVLNAVEGRPNQAAVLANALAERFTSKASKNLRRLRLHHQLARFEYVDSIKQLIEMIELPAFANKPFETQSASSDKAKVEFKSCLDRAGPGSNR